MALVFFCLRIASLCRRSADIFSSFSYTHTYESCVHPCVNVFV